MWLHDFLPKTISNIRVLTYGYNSGIVGNVSDDFSTIEEYKKGLIHALESARKSEEVYIHIRHLRISYLT